MAKRPKLRTLLRLQIYERDGYTCRHCAWSPPVPDGYRGHGPISVVVGEKQVVTYRRLSFNGGQDDIRYRMEPVYRRLEIDHINPLSNGGSFDDPANLQALCSPCNNRKGARA